MAYSNLVSSFALFARAPDGAPSPHRFVSCLAACALALTLPACGDEDSKDQSEDADHHDAGQQDAAEPDASVPDSAVDAAPARRAVSIDFAAVVGSAPFSCGTTFTNLGSSRASAVFKDFRLYLYDVRLVDAAGTETPVTLDQSIWQYQDAVLLDFEDGTGNCGNGSTETNTKITGEVASGDYTGVIFKVGLPPALNHSDPTNTPAPLDLPALSWGWNMGRTFVVIDMVTTPVGDGAGVPFPVHAGSTMCTGNALAGEQVSCQRRNVGEVKFATFNTEGSKIVIDCAELLKGVAIDGSGTGCMSSVGDPECDIVLPRLGIDFTTGGTSASTQTVFSVVAK